MIRIVFFSFEIYISHSCKNPRAHAHTHTHISMCDWTRNVQEIPATVSPMASINQLRAVFVNNSYSFISGIKLRRWPCLIQRWFKERYAYYRQTRMNMRTAHAHAKHITLYSRQIAPYSSMTMTVASAKRRRSIFFRTWNIYNTYLPSFIICII